MDKVRHIAKGMFCSRFVPLYDKTFEENLLCVNCELNIYVLVAENSGLDPNSFFPDNRYNHVQQVQERLNFLRFLLKVCALKCCRLFLVWGAIICAVAGLNHNNAAYGSVGRGSI